MALLIIYLISANLMTFYLFWDDKKMAIKKRAWRTSEKKLLTFALIGGTPAAFLACHLFRHKTRKKDFRMNLYLIAAAQILAFIVFGFML